MTASNTRILLVAPRVWDGGVEMHLSNLALLYAAHGYRVTLAVDPRFPAHPGRGQKLAASGAELVRVPEYESEPLPLRLWKRRAAFGRALAPRSFDAVLCQGFGYSLPWFRRFLAPGGRFIWHEHTDGACSRIVQPGFHTPLPARYPRLFRRMFRHLDAAVTGSARGVANLRCIQGLGCPVHVLAPLMEAGAIPDAAEREAGTRPLRIGVFGTIHTIKGSEAILRLWPSLGIGPATLHFHGPLATAPLDALANALGVPAVFHGPYRSENLPALMQATDMAVIPSLTEGYPLTAWECMAWGVPFVITDVGAAPEFTRDNPNARLAALAPDSVRRKLEEHVAALRAGRLSRAALQQHQRRYFAREDAARVPVPALMTAALLAIYAFTCAALLWDGWRQSNPFIELTFLVGAGSSIVLLPQGLALWLAGDMLPEAALAKAFLMAALSNIALLAGWRRYAPLPAPPAPPHHPLELRRAFWWGALFIAIGLASSIVLASLAGGLFGQFTSSGAYAVEWRGMPVVWVFFVSFLMTGIALTALAALGLHSRARLLVPLLAALLPLAWVVLLNRRSAAAALAITAAGVLAFGTSRQPPRWAVPALVAGGFAIAFLFPALRGNDFVHGDFSRLATLEPARVVTQGLVNPDAEFAHLVYGMAVTSTDQAYEFGAGFYNMFITLFVPKLLVGEAAKQDLLLHTSASDYFNNSLGWSARPTTAPTGPGCAFRQFGYFGCFYFFLVARALRILAEKARRENDLFAQTFFIILLAPAVAAMTNDIYTLYHPLFVHLPALLVARHFCHA